MYVPERLDIILQLLYGSVPPLVVPILPLPPPLIHPPLPPRGPQRPEKIQHRKKNLDSPCPGYSILRLPRNAVSNSLARPIRWEN